MADTGENRAEFGCPGAGRGESALPKLRFVALVENGTHVLFGARLGRYAEGETTLAHGVVPALRASHAVPGRPAGLRARAVASLRNRAAVCAGAATGADLLWRGRCNLRLPREAALADGSYLTTIHPGDKDRRHRTGGVPVRVVEYRLEGVAEAEPLYRLVTTILDATQAPAADLAARADEDPDTLATLGASWLSFLHAVRVVRRKLPLLAAFPPSAPAGSA